MTLSVAGFPGQVNDREWASVLSLIGNDAVSGFNVSAAGGDRMLSVSSGVAFVGGLLFTSDATESLQLPANPSSFPRKDYVILRGRWSDEFHQLTYRQGTPSSGPIPPWGSIVREPGVQYEVPLAIVDVASGQGELSSGDVTRTNSPPPTDFYYLNSIGQAPHHTDGALVYHNPSGVLSVGTPSGYKDIAGGSASPLQLPSPGGSGWDHSTTYQSRATMVEVNIFVYRNGGNTGENNVRLGVLPSGSRPPRLIYRDVMNQHSGRHFLVEIQTNGVITAIGLQANNGQRIRGGFSFFI